MKTYIVRDENNTILFATDNAAKACTFRDGHEEWTTEVKYNMRQTLRRELLRQYGE